MKSDWLRITITDNTVKEWNGSDWSAAGEGVTGLMNNSTCWVYGYIVKYVIVTNSQTYYLEDLTRLNNDIVKTNITSITITNSVTEIGENAFSGINDNVLFIIPEGVLSKLNEADTSLDLTYGIGKSFFDASNAILVKDYPYYTIVTNDNQIHYLSSFSNNKNENEDARIITGITLDSTVVTIDTITITHVIIGNSVTSIGDNAFRDCSRLASLNIPKSVTSIGNNAFRQCSNLESTVDDTLIIPDSVETIGNGAFGQCSSLVSVTIGNSVKSIGNNAFNLCPLLASLIIPNSVETIGHDAFDPNTTITLESEIKLTSFPGISSVSSLDTNDDFTTTNGLIINIHTKALLRVTNTNTNIIIPNDVTSIGYSAFSNSEVVTTVTMGDSVKTIGERAFYRCSELTEVTIGNSVTSIGDGAFFQCSSLGSVIIPNSVTSIGNFAFSGISANAEITIHVDALTAVASDLTYGTDRDFFSSPSRVTLIDPNA